MLLLTGGFVLGEVVILHQSTMKELAPLFSLALVLGVAAVCTDRRRWIFWDRSIGIRLLALFVILGMMRGYSEERIVLREQELLQEKESTCGIGEICGITEKESWTVLLLKQVQTEKGSLRFLQVYAEKTEKSEEKASKYCIGDRVRVWGEFNRFQPASNPGEFDYATYYRGQKLIWRVFALAIRKQDPDNRQEQQLLERAFRNTSCSLLNEIQNVRTWSADRLKLLAGEEDGSLFSAMLLGDKSGMSEEIRDLYQKNGIAHLLAVSGLHLSLVSMAAYGLLRKAGVGYGCSAMAGGLILIGYSILTGASPSVIRALIMTLCGFLAAYLGRTYDLLSAMGLSALLLLGQSPYLVDQAGVQLSFAAIAGIGLANELEETKNPLRLTLCMQLVSLPIVLWHFFSYPLYGIFLNLLVVPLTGIIVGTGAGGLAVSLLSLRAGVFFTGGGRAVLAWYELCCRCFMKLPGSSLLCGRPRLWQILCYYMMLGTLLFLFYGRRTPDKKTDSEGNPGLRKKREGMLLGYLLFALFFLHPFSFRGLEVTILDTGQGDGICIRMKDQVILVDGGSTDQKELGKYRLEPFLKSMGIRQIDLAIVSHGDWDHISGLRWLMEEAAEETGAVRVKAMALPEIGKGEEVYAQLQELCEKQGGRTFWIGRGDQITQSEGFKKKGSPSLLCLYPKGDTVQGSLTGSTDRNEHSLVLRLDYGEFHMLLTGDMSARGEENLIALEQGHLQDQTTETKRADEVRAETKDIWVLKVAHHGSGYSSSEEFLSWLRPDYAVISCGAENRYGHPHPDVLKRLSDCKSEILQTKDSGAVIWRTDGKRITYTEWKGEES